MLLEELTSLFGVSGNENEVRNFIIDQVTPYADSVKIDAMGNIIAVKEGNGDKKVMLSAHMDEVGFIISEITDKGFLKFQTVGGIDTRTIISKKIVIGKNKVPGVIGMKAIHLQKSSERESVPEVKELFIDIGANNKEEAEKLVSLGDYAAFNTKYEIIGKNAVKAKAIDDRVGCAILLELIKIKQKYDTYFCFTTQEEVGLRGARCAAYSIKPDIALVIEATSCSDVYGFKPHENVTTFGGGVAVTFMDRGTIVNEELKNKLYNLAIENNIPVQYKCSTAGGNDAGRIHITRDGIKTASLSVPCRYLHSACSLANMKDITATRDLAQIFLDKIDEVI